MKPRKPQRVLMNQGQIWQNVGSLRLCGSPTSWEMLDEERADDPALFLILADETMLGRVIVAQHSPIRAPPAAEVAQPNTAAMHFSISQKMANITLHCERLLYCVEFTLRDFRPQPPPLPLPSLGILTRSMKQLAIQQREQRAKSTKGPERQDRLLALIKTALEERSANDQRLTRLMEEMLTVLEPSSPPADTP